MNPSPVLYRNQSLPVDILIQHLSNRSFIQTNATFLSSKITFDQPTCTSLPSFTKMQELILASRTIRPIPSILATVFDYSFAVSIVAVGGADGTSVFTAAAVLGRSQETSQVAARSGFKFHLTSNSRSASKFFWMIFDDGCSARSQVCVGQDGIFCGIRGESELRIHISVLDYLTLIPI